MRISIEDLELTDNCRRCDGYGYTYPYFSGPRANERVECANCKGVGEVLSANGEQLIQFLKTYWNQVET